GVVTHGFLDRLQVDFQASVCVAVDRHGVEDQWVTLLGCAKRNHNSLWLTQLKRTFPCLQSQAELELGDHVLESLKASLVVPDLQKQGVDQHTGSKGTVTRFLALEEAIMCFPNGERCGGSQDVAP